ncbi:MAG: transposase [Thermodesulfobacteriota bacterium]
MARKPRIHKPGGYYHVIIRGNDRQEIFFDEQDRIYYESLISEGVERFKYKVHAYSFMSNHVHLLIQVSDIKLSKIIQNISFRYTKYINKKKSRIGHLFQGRYKAILIDADSYLLELVRYIHLNPVRANMVEKLEEYKWSGHLCYLGKIKKKWFSTNEVLSQFSARKGKARSKYQEFVYEGIGVEGVNYKREIKEGRIMGEDKFIEEVLKENEEKEDKILEMEVIIKRVCKYYGMTEKELRRKDKNRDIGNVRNIIGYLVREYSGSTIKKYSEEVGRDITSISKGMRKVREKMESNKELADEINKLIPICQA